MKLNTIREAYIAEGASYLDASSRTSQEVILTLIAKSPLAKNVTIKGGVVIQHISGNNRRATQDLDFDFVKYSIEDDSIRAFIKRLNEQSEDIHIAITAPIEELKHQDYSGKRVNIRITDVDGTNIDTKLDIGVHNSIAPEQKNYCFDLGKLDDSVTLLANTKEQIFTEKLKSLLRLGAVSTRYKDVFDMYYLAVIEGLDKDAIMMNFRTAIFDDKTMRENNIADIVSRLDKVLHDPRFARPLRQSKRNNWIDIDAEKAINRLLAFF